MEIIIKAQTGNTMMTAVPPGEMFHGHGHAMIRQIFSLVCSQETDFDMDIRLEDSARMGNELNNVTYLGISS